MLITCRCRVTATYPPDFRHSLSSLRRCLKSDPLAFLEELAGCSDDDIVSFSLAGRPAFLVKDPEIAETVLAAQHHTFVKAYGLQRARRLLGNGLLTAEGERHRRQRNLVQPAFHRQQLERYAKSMVAHAARVRDRWQPRQSIDVSAEAGALTLAIVGETLFGADVESLSVEVRQALMTASDALDPLVSLLAPVRRVRPQRDRLARVIDDLIAQHLQTGSDRENLISLLLAGQDTGSNTITDQVRDDALTILLAGHDTIATALVWTWILLDQHPDAGARLEQEVHALLGSRRATAADVPALGFTRAVLAESLRLRPPAWIVARSPAADVELGGIGVQAGSIVLISPYLMHRDARFYRNPLAFEPDRWLDERQVGRPKMAYVPFGAGPRSCIGEGFAWMEGVLLLATFAQRWRLRLVGRDEVQPHPQITLRPPAGVTMMVHPI